MLKSTSTAPDFVPVAIQGAFASGDQAKVAVRGISLSRTMTGEILSWADRVNFLEPSKGTGEGTTRDEV